VVWVQARRDNNPADAKKIFKGVTPLFKRGDRKDGAQKKKVLMHQPYLSFDAQARSIKKATHRNSR
jgi:hypothetical protein